MSQYQSVEDLHNQLGRQISPLIIGRSNNTELAFRLYDSKAISLFGLPLANRSLEQTASSIVDAASKKERNIIQFINAHCINQTHHDVAYRKIVEKADLLLPDGSGLRLASVLAGTGKISNLNGTDLFPFICKQAAEKGQSIFLLGGEPGIAAAAAKNMRRAIPDLNFVGTQNGFFSKGTDAEIIQRINASGASILLVGMGVPMQEKWIAKHRNQIETPVIMGVGGLFDYYSGKIARAPKPLRYLGMEWIWRLAMEPKRLANRYFAGNIRFIFRSLAHAFVVRGHAERYAAASKRTLDLAIALFALVLLGPLAAAICLFITMEDRGSPFFRQTRIGADGKPFKIWKFRSMYKNAEARKSQLADQNERDSVCFKMKDDPRITKVGKWIRRTSLDELPQILNILNGQMSVVGPRPALPCEVLSYEERERRRLNGKPGLTCTWQVSGRADIPFEQQVEMDLEYLEEKSILKDIKLITQTVPAVISGRGAY